METSLREPAPPRSAPPRRRLGLVLNEKAGALLADAGHGEALLARLRDSGDELCAHQDGDLPARIRAAAAEAEMVVVAGGDGTVACAAATLAGQPTPLALIPCGTMNLLAKDLRLPIGDAAAATELIAAGHVRAIDAASAGDETFLCACMMGTPARLGHHREEARKRGPVRQWLTLLPAAWRVLRRRRTERFTLVVDGAARGIRTSALTIVVNRLDDAAGHLFGRTTLDGGELVAYAARQRGALGLVRALWQMAVGRPTQATLTCTAGRRMTVSTGAEAIRVLVDGEERLLPNPLVFQIRPGALRVVAPPPLVPPPPIPPPLASPPA